MRYSPVFLLAHLLTILAFALPADAQAIPQYARELLDAHNAYRTQIGEQPLAWSTRLAQRSEEWAMLLFQKGRFEPRRDGVFGENLFEKEGAASSPAEVVAAWMSEKRYYNESANSCSARCGHFTQVVWRETRLVGCGVAHTKTKEIWVCNYDPPGNLAGERPY